MLCESSVFSQFFFRYMHPLYLYSVYCYLTGISCWSGTNSVQGNSIDDMKTMLDTNVLAVMAFTKAFSAGMVARNRQVFLALHEKSSH